MKIGVGAVWGVLQIGILGVAGQNFFYREGVDAKKRNRVKGRRWGP